MTKAFKRGFIDMMRKIAAAPPLRVEGAMPGAGMLAAGKALTDFGKEHEKKMQQERAKILGTDTAAAPTDTSILKARAAYAPIDTSILKARARAASAPIDTSAGIGNYGANTVYMTKRVKGDSPDTAPTLTSHTETNVWPLLSHSYFGRLLANAGDDPSLQRTVFDYAPESKFRKEYVDVPWIGEEPRLSISLGAPPKRITGSGYGENRYMDAVKSGWGGKVYDNSGNYLYDLDPRDELRKAENVDVSQEALDAIRAQMAADGNIYPKGSAPYSKLDAAYRAAGEENQEAYKETGNVPKRTVEGYDWDSLGLDLTDEEKQEIINYMNIMAQNRAGSSGIVA